MDLEKALAFGEYSGGSTPQYILAARVRELERENARLRESLEIAERELVHLFTVLPIGGVLPSPSVMQHVQWARLSNASGEPCPPPANQSPKHHE